MSDPAFLNVDEITPAVRKVVQIKGKKHNFVQPNVGDFLNEMKRIKDMQKRHDAKKGSEDEFDQVEVIEDMISAMKNSIKASFPTVTEKDLDSLTYEQMEAIRQFISSQITEQSANAEDASGNG